MICIIWNFLHFRLWFNQISKKQNQISQLDLDENSFWETNRVETNFKKSFMILKECNPFWSMVLIIGNLFRLFSGTKTRFLILWDHIKIKNWKYHFHVINSNDGFDWNDQNCRKFPWKIETSHTIFSVVGSFCYIDILSIKPWDLRTITVRRYIQLISSPYVVLKESYPRNSRFYVSKFRIRESDFC